MSLSAKVALTSCLFAICSLAYGNALYAGPNEAGTLLLHHNADLVYTSGDSYCGTSALVACEDANVRAEIDGVRILHVLAAFVEESHPRLSGLTFGIEYDVSVRIVDAAACGDFELRDFDWPVSGSGTAVTWTYAVTHTLVEVYWFAAYSDVHESQQFSLVPHPAQGGWFGDDSIPSKLDAIAGYGTMGFGIAGTVVCPIAPIPGACCFSDGSCLLLRASACQEQRGDFSGEGTTCTPNPCPQFGACCYPDGYCEVFMAVDCAMSSGDFQGEGTVCDPNPCPQNPGACCFSSGECRFESEYYCARYHGVFLGRGVVCEPNPCLQPGACCYPDGRCLMLFTEECVSSGGGYQGDGTGCDPTPCPQNFGACCYWNGVCEVLAEYLCADVYGSYLGSGTSCEPNECPQLGACCLPNGACVVRLPGDCANEGGDYLGSGTGCDPYPCVGSPPPGACCFSDGHCEVLSRSRCEQGGGSFLGSGVSCTPNPCAAGTGACCIDCTCLELSQSECDARDGFFLGIGTSCTPDACGAVPHDANPSAAAGHVPGSVRASVGAGQGTVTEVHGRPGCSSLVMNADETYEEGYAWRYGGIVPPDYGAFAERYFGSSQLCAAVFDFTATGAQMGQSMDIIVYNDAGNVPGAVVFRECVTPGPIATWPAVSRHTFPIHTVCTDDAWWIACWTIWPGAVEGWYVAADLDGFGGFPYTNIAPGIGYPTGWNNVSIAWRPTRALGIGAEIVRCDSTPTIGTTWGKIKQMFRE